MMNPLLHLRLVKMVLSHTVVESHHYLLGEEIADVDEVEGREMRKDDSSRTKNRRLKQMVIVCGLAECRWLEWW